MGSQAQQRPGPLPARSSAETLPENGADGGDGTDFRLLAEALPHLVWVCRPDGTLDYLNRQGLEFFGPQLRDASCPFPSGPGVHPEDEARALAVWANATRSGEPLQLEARLRRFDGAFRWHISRAQPVRDSQGNIVKWMGTSTNVHDVKEANDRGAFLLALSTELAPMGNPQELVCAAMGRLRERLGATLVTLVELDEAQGEAVMLRQRASDAKQIEIASLPLRPYENLAIRARQGLMTVMRDVRNDSRAASLYDRWFGLEGVGAVMSAPLLQSGSLVALLSVVEAAPRNWTESEVELVQRVASIVWPAFEKARADRALAMSEQRLRLAQAVAQIGTWELDPDSHAMYLSSESYELFGLPAGERLLQRWLEQVDSRDRGAVRQLIEECVPAGSAEAEYRYAHPERGVRWIYSRAGMVDYAGQRCIVGINLDVTERRKVEEALKDVNQRKDEFLAMLGHELRNPLAPIRSAVQILRIHAAGKPELEWARAVIDRQTRHLVRLVDDLLDVSRMLRGQIVLQREQVELAEIVRHGVETSRPLIRARRHRLHVQGPHTSVHILGDLTRLAQVLANLLNNAAKYTDEGGDIWLETGVQGRQAVLLIRDTGAGIAPALLPRVFELFTQAERTLDRAQGGLGIGLTLVKLLVEMHGGNVEARSAGPGKGAEFIVRLPVSEPEMAAGRLEPPSEHGALAPADAPEEQPLRVLVVDDNVDAAESVAMLLSMEGYEAQSVHSGSAALEAVGSLKPDVVLLDIGLPEMDGYDVARRLHEQFPIGAPILIALTGYGQPSDRDRALRAGFDEFLVKPVEPNVLTALLEGLPTRQRD
jgi:PAS domain S-box-containing protein